MTKTCNGHDQSIDLVNECTVIIYQLPQGDSRKFWGNSSKFSKPFDRAAYEKIYECKRIKEYNQNTAWEEFNICHPADYKGHSLSVSDIVSIDGKEFFCDSIGWLEVVDGKLQQS